MKSLLSGDNGCCLTRAERLAFINKRPASLGFRSPGYCFLRVRKLWSLRAWGWISSLQLKLVMCKTLSRIVLLWEAWKDDGAHLGVGTIWWGFSLLEERPGEV